MKAIVVVLILLIGGIVTPVACVGCWLARDAASIVNKEFSPSALLKKYELFKDMASQLDAKRASIRVSERRMSDLRKMYNDEPRSKWSRSDQEQYNLYTQESAGMKASYNQLAAQYNSGMSKENYKFANVAELPQGASSILPREYRSYLEE